jgi:hypothetical protein
VTAHLRWSKGGEARVLTITSDAITLDSSVPSPPGSRIEGTVLSALAAQDAGATTLLRIKIHASRRQPDGRFHLEGRPLDLSREARSVLEGLTCPRAAPQRTRRRAP